MININTIDQNDIRCSGRIRRNCIVCKNPTANEHEHLCEECKDTIEFVKCNKSIIYDMINKFMQGENK